MSNRNRRSKKTYKPPGRKNRQAGYGFRANRRKNPSNEKVNKRSSYAYVCPTPVGYCSGAMARNRIGNRSHPEPEQVIACQGRYLEGRGFKKISKREFINPESGRIFIINRHPVRTKEGKANEKLTSQYTNPILW